MIVDLKIYEVKVYVIIEGLRRYYKDLNKMWKEGFIDKEVFV